MVCSGRRFLWFNGFPGFKYFGAKSFALDGFNKISHEVLLRIQSGNQVKMLTSQTSSSSASSVLSPKHEEARYPEELPQKFRNCFVYFRKVYFLDETVNLIITNCEVIESKRSEVVNYLNLANHCQELQNISPSDVDFDSIVQQDLSFYVLKIRSKLFAIQRRSSQLKLIKILNNVKCFMPVVDKAGELTVEVTFNDASKQLTSFRDELLEEFLRQRHSDKFSSIFNCVQHKTKSVQASLRSVTDEVERMDRILFGNSKFLPKMLLDDDPDSKCPLVRYGSIWTRTHNDKIVIGIPIFCVSKRWANILLQKYVFIIRSGHNKFSNWTMS